MDMKKCNHCKKDKELVEFGKDKHQKDSLNPKCRKCCQEFQAARKEEKKAYDAEYRQKNSEKLKRQDRERHAAQPEVHRAYKLFKTFGITLDEYEKKLKDQNGICAVCHKPEWVKVRGKVKRLAVDHRKQPFQVRGLLCNNCNRALGLLFESPKTIQNLLEYILFWNYPKV